MAETVIRSILVAAYNSDLNQMRVKNMVKWTFGYCNIFVTHVSMIFMRENAAFIHVLIDQDWDNKLLNTILN